VAGERILSAHKIERTVHSLGWNSPCYQRTRREIVRHQRLTNAADSARREHSAKALDHDFFWKPRPLRYLRKRFLEKSGKTVLGDRQDSRIRRVTQRSRDLTNCRFHCHADRFSRARRNARLRTPMLTA
jgi:hypothetical protein